MFLKIKSDKNPTPLLLACFLIPTWWQAWLCFLFFPSTPPCAIHSTVGTVVYETQNVHIHSKAHSKAQQRWVGAVVSRSH